MHLDLLLGKSNETQRVNPRKSWSRNLEEVNQNGDFEVTFHLKRPPPAFLALPASGFSPVYPCRVPPRDMRSHPIATSPFQVKVTRHRITGSSTAPLSTGSSIR